jgi:hypothetical protein
MAFRAWRLGAKSVPAHVLISGGYAFLEATEGLHPANFSVMPGRLVSLLRGYLAAQNS